MNIKQHYLGNPKLKASGVEVEFDKSKLNEYLKCSSDPLHFIENYIKIIHIDRGLVNFDMYDYQRNMVEKFDEKRFVICKMPRQTGKSTTIVSYLLHQILFKPELSVAILANKGSTARDLLSKIKLAYEELPFWLQQGVVTWNKGDIELENNSKIIARSTSASAIRGGSFNIIFLDEFAFVPHNMAEEFFNSVYPTISSGKKSKVLIVSTPNGMNMFYKLWKDAEEGNNDYHPIDIHWSEVPGRDENWKNETIRNTSEEQFRQEFECEFIGSTHTLISGAKLRTLTFKKPKYTKENLDVYEEPQPEKTYVMTVDVARGIEGDCSAFVVIDVSDNKDENKPYNIVAKYRSNKISPLVFPTIIVETAAKFNNAYVLIEVNDIGGQVADIVYYEYEYENLLLSSLGVGRNGQQIGGGFGNNTQLGIRTSRQVKRLGCSTLKSLVEEDKLIVNDFQIIEELSSFVAKNQTYMAEEGKTDDLAMCLVMFSWLVLQEYFKELLNIDIREKLFKNHIKNLEEDLLPFGYIDDGINSNDPEIETINNEALGWSLGYGYLGKV